MYFDESLLAASGRNFEVSAQAVWAGQVHPLESLAAVRTIAIFQVHVAIGRRQAVDPTPHGHCSMLNAMS